MDAILLAAGNSARFGENKLLYRLNGKPMYRYMLELLDRQKKARILENVIVVSQYEEIFTEIRNHFPGIEMVENPAPELGISSSIGLGLAHLEQVSPDSGACLFAVADQPFFTMESLVKTEQFWQNQECGIVAASCEGRMKNPVIFDAKYYEELKQLEGDTGGKQVLLKHLEDTGLCEILARELVDLDTGEAVKGCLDIYFPFLKEKGHVISIVGAGGKTTLMNTLARYYARQGGRVVVTTTTHIKRPPDYPIAGNLEELRRFLAEKQIVAAGDCAPEGKLTRAGTMTVKEYQEAADLVLVEADGAKHFPCKAPAEHEPVIPEETTIVLGVVGMDALGKPLEQVCFRKEQAMELLGRKAEHCMTEEDLAGILSSERGTRKGVGDRPCYIVLNQCDDEVRRQQAERIQDLLAEKGIVDVVCISLREFHVATEETALPEENPMEGRETERNG